MIEMNNELITAMRRFKEVFGDIVPLPPPITFESD